MREFVTDVEDPRLADYARLTDMELRTSLESAQGLFIAEGTKVISRAVAAGYPVRSVLLAERRLGDLPALPASGAPVYVVPDETAERLTGYRVHRGALASLHRKPLPETAALAAAARRVIVLEDLVDHANVGAIFRCAAALGVDAVFLSPRCADPLYRRAVKVSMGAVFAIPYARMTGWYDGLAGLRAAGFRLLALTPDPTATPIGAGRGRPADRAAARHRGRRTVVPLAARGRSGRPHPDASRRPGRRGRLAQCGRRRRDRMPRARGRRPGSSALAILVSATTSTSWPALVKIATDETGRFSSSLNFTATAAAGAVLRAPALRRGRRPRVRPPR